jgi:hypothetical protein
MPERRIYWRRKGALDVEPVGISPINRASLLRDIIPRLSEAADSFASMSGTEFESIKPFDIATAIKERVLVESDTEIINAEKAIAGIAPELLESEPYSEYMEIIEHEKAIKEELEGSPDSVMFEAFSASCNDCEPYLRIVIDAEGKEIRKSAIRDAVIAAIKAGWPYG